MVVQNGRNREHLTPFTFRTQAEIWSIPALVLRLVLMTLHSRLTPTLWLPAA